MGSDIAGAGKNAPPDSCGSFEKEDYASLKPAAEGGHGSSFGPARSRKGVCRNLEILSSRRIGRAAVHRRTGKDNPASGVSNALPFAAVGNDARPERIYDRYLSPDFASIARPAGAGVRRLGGARDAALKYKAGWAIGFSAA